MKVKHYLIPFVVLSIFACSNNQRDMGNPLLAKYRTPHKTVPFDLIKVSDFAPAFDTAFNDARIEIAAILKNQDEPTFANTIEALENTGDLLDHLSLILFNLNSAETNDSIQALARDISPRLTEFQNDITLNEELFRKVKYVKENTDPLNLTPEQNQLLENTYKSFVRNGANLNEKDKETFREVSKNLAELSVKFGENVLAETNDYLLHITDSADLSGLPGDVITAAAEEAKSRDMKGWVFTLKFPSFIPFLKYCDNRKLREELTTAYGSRAMRGNEHDNQEIIRQITNQRLQIANLLGYPSYSAYILDNRMAETPDRVMDFLEELSKAYYEPAKEEVAMVTEYARSTGADFELQRWDWSYYSEKLKKEKYELDDEITRPYFQLENVTQGVFNLATELYGITFRENKSVPVYHPDVKAFEVYDENNEYLAVLYMDFFPREGKRQGAWMTEFQQQEKINGKNIRPHISLVFNFTKPTGEKPSLLTYSELRTTLHEFGHALHGMLSEVTYSSLAGTNVYRDFVELPSQIMENWAEQEDWLNKIAVHYETGETMPEELLQKIIDSKNYLAAYSGTRQVNYGTIDMAWHSLTEPFEGNVEDYETRVMAGLDIIPPIKGTAMSPSFSHIFAGGYAAGYYGYKWAEVLDADAFSLFLKNGIYDKETAASFRENILSKGGTEPPMQLYIRFRGQEPSIEPLLERSGLIKS
jgi:peptidyl-dipeptidase Dcp